MLYVVRIMWEAILVASAAVIAGLASAYSANENRESTEDANAENWENTKELNQNKLQWAVEDAKKAGLNPYSVAGGTSVATYKGSTPATMDLGQTIDTLRHSADYALNLKKTKKEIESADKANEKATAEINLLEAERNNVLADTQNKSAIAYSNQLDLARNRAEFYHQFGLNYGSDKLLSDVTHWDNDIPGGWDLSKTSFGEELTHKLNYLRNKAEIAQKENDFYALKEIRQTANDIIDGIADFKSMKPTYTTEQTDWWSGNKRGGSYKQTYKGHNFY